MRTISRQIYMTIALLGLLFGTSGCAGAQDSERQVTASQALVQSYTNAYNAQDLAKMTLLMHENIEWINLEDSDLTVITEGQDALVSELKSYFSGDSKAISTLSDWSTNGKYVSVKETVSFTLKDGSQGEQASLSVYELDGGLIRRVWYFPAE